MVKDIRVTYRRRHSYNTKSNKVKHVRTPGGRLVVHYVKKHAKGVKCAECPTILPGVAHLRPSAKQSVGKHKRSVARSYGGKLCANCTRTRILRAFIVEEQKIVKKKLVEKANTKK